MSTQDVSSDVKLTIVEHLEELRDRLIVIAVALLVGTAFSLFFTDSLLEVLIQPMKDVGIKPLAIHPVEPFVVYFKVALIAGVAIAMPVILYEVVRYLLPALTPKEKQYLYLLLPFGTIFFTGGLVFASFIMLPTAVHFLAGFLRNLVDRGWTMDNYVSFVTTIMFWMGIIFELPLVMFFMAKLNIVTTKMLAGFFRFWIVLAAVIAAVVTPTPDPVNMSIVMVPLILLYGVGMLLVRLAGK